MKLNALKRFERFFLSVYDRESFVIRNKSFILLWIIIVALLVLMAVMIVNILTSVSTSPHLINISNSVLVAGCVMGLFMLRSGNIDTAVRVIACAVILRVIAGSVIKQGDLAVLGSNNNFYFYFAAIAFTGLFGTRFMIVTVTVIFIMASLSIVMITKVFYPTANLNYIIGSVINMDISIILMSSMMYMVALITERALDTADEYSANLEKRVVERTGELEAARDLLMKDLDLARKIEFALLPGNIPEIDRVDIAFSYEPMMSVGGDFVDVLCPPDGTVGLFICDVSGHGVSAALMASMVKMSLSSWLRYNDQPKIHLSHIREQLSGKMGDNFITACVGHFNPHTGQFRYSAAGHPPLIIVRKNGTVEKFEMPGGLLCDKLPEIDFREAATTLLPGDTLVMYTDGVIEARREDEFFGENRLSSSIVEYRDFSAAEICHSIHDRVKSYAGSGALEDDFTIIVLKYR